MTSRSVRISELLDDLVGRLVPQAKQEGKAHQELLRYACRIASSRLNALDQEQENRADHRRLNDELFRLVRRIVRDRETREKCDELLFMLVRGKHQLRRLEAVIRMLCDLGGSQSSSKGMGRDDNILGVLPIGNEQGRREAKLESLFQGSASNKPSRWIEEPLSEQKRGVLTEKEKKLLETESLLVRDVLYAFQGVDGHLIKYSAELDSFEVADLSTIPTSMKRLVEQLCEVGWLYTRLSRYVDQTLNEDSLGLVSQSFAYGLQAEIGEYFRLIAVLESQLEPDMGDMFTREKQKAHFLPLTLRQLSVWSQEPRRRLQLMCEMCDAVKGLRGGAMASVLHIYSYNGDPFVSSFVESIMQRVSAPIFESIRLWVCHGELSDHCAEFFVSSNEAVPDQRLWFDKYHLRTSMIPGFIGDTLALKILMIGKSINFLRYCCAAELEDSEDSSSNEIEKEFSTLQITLPGEDEERAEQLRESNLAQGTTDKRTVNLLSAINRAAKITNKRLRSILFEQFNLMDHCLKLKQYLMLGQGDTIQYLMDLLSPHLDQPAVKLYQHTLLAQLETAVRASNIQDADAVLARLDVRLMESSPGDTGWDVFVLDYHLDMPISCVITKESMKQYYEIFTFLWRLKRVEYSLNAAWKQEMTTEHVVRGMNNYIKHTLHKFHVLRNEMIHFTSNLHSYIMFEVLETSWESLVNDLAAAVDLDEVVQSHENYLNKIIDKSLIGPNVRIETEMGISPIPPTSEAGKARAKQQQDEVSLRQRMHNLFDLILRFCNVQKRLYTHVNEQVNKLESNRRNIIERTKNRKWGIDDNSVDDASSMLSEDQAFSEQTMLAQEYNRQIAVIAKEYRSSFMEFLECLKPASSENLKFLCFRLDFNLFYENSNE